MQNRRSYYRILHVEPDAPTAVIKASYRAIMQRLGMHPDLGGNHAEAVLINEAFDTLCDPARRAAYDRALGRPVDGRRSRRGSPTPMPAAASPVPPPAAEGTPGCHFCGAPCTTSEMETPDGACGACRSPLFPARRCPAEGASRRAIARAPRNLPMTFRLATRRDRLWHGTTQDLSLNGMRFLSDAVIPIGERLRIECEFCCAVAIVTNVRPSARMAGGASRYGVQFLTMRLMRERGGMVSTRA